MLMQAVPKLPKNAWKEIIAIVPAVVAGAKEVYDKWSSRSKPVPVDPQSEIKSQIAAIVERLQVLEASGVDQANLAQQIAEQLQGLSAGLTEVSGRSSMGMWFGIGSLTVSIVALLVFIIR